MFSVKARRLPQSETFHSVAIASPAKARLIAATAVWPRYFRMLSSQS